MKIVVQEVRSDIEKWSLPIDSNLSEDFVTFLTNSDQGKFTPFMKIFWKYIKENARDVKYLMIIRFCLSLASKSASASDNIRLKRKLGDDRYYSIKTSSKRWFTKLSEFSENKNIFVLQMDEMEI